MPRGLVELAQNTEERGEVRGDRMREQRGTGHTHTAEVERERGRGGGGLTESHIGHFGDIPCREVSVELIRRRKH